MCSAFLKEPQSNTKQQGFLKISAKKAKKPVSRISQGDIFEDITIIEDIEIEKSVIRVKKISFPYVVCLNQECDLESDFKKNSEKQRDLESDSKKNSEKQCDSNLLHLAIAPAFIFEQFLSGSHWGDIFENNIPQKRGDSIIKKIVQNEIPRYHYLYFPKDSMPELIIDFKHFFTINRAVLYSNIGKRLCSLDDLFREKINQRFSYFISRIGLPEHLVS